MLLSRMIRTVAITGSTEAVDARMLGRQGGRWAEQWVGAAFPQAAPHPQRRPAAAVTRPPADPAQSLQTLTELHARGVVTDAEFEQLRGRLPA